MSENNVEIFLKKLVQGGIKDLYEDSQERFTRAMDLIEEGEMKKAIRTLGASAGSMRLLRAFSKQLGSKNSLYKAMSTAFDAASNLSQDLEEKRLMLEELGEETEKEGEELPGETAEILESAEENPEEEDE